MRRPKKCLLPKPRSSVLTGWYTGASDPKLSGLLLAARRSHATCQRSRAPSSRYIRPSRERDPRTSDHSSVGHRGWLLLDRVRPRRSIHAYSLFYHPLYIVGISKIRYVLATPPYLDWRHDLQRTSLIFPSYVLLTSLTNKLCVEGQAMKVHDQRSHRPMVGVRKCAKDGQRLVGILNSATPGWSRRTQAASRPFERSPRDCGATKRRSRRH
jgi:hypothetical protein